MHVLDVPGQHQRGAELVAANGALVLSDGSWISDLRTGLGRLGSAGHFHVAGNPEVEGFLDLAAVRRLDVKLQLPAVVEHSRAVAAAVGRHDLGRLLCLAGPLFGVLLFGVIRDEAVVGGQKGARVELAAKAVDSNGQTFDRLAGLSLLRQRDGHNFFGLQGSRTGGFLGHGGSNLEGSFSCRQRLSQFRTDRSLKCSPRSN